MRGFAVLPSRRIPFDKAALPTRGSIPDRPGRVPGKSNGDMPESSVPILSGCNFYPRKISSLFASRRAKPAQDPNGASHAALPRPSTATHTRNLIRRLDKLQEAFDQLDWRPLKGATPDLRRLQVEADRVFSTLDSVSEFSLGVLLGLHGLNRSYEPWLSAEAARKADDYVAKIFSDPRNLRLMTSYLSPKYKYSGYQEEMFLKYRLLPAVRDLLLHTKNGEWLPALPDLLTLAKTHPPLEGPAAMAAAYRAQWLEGKPADPAEFDSAGRAELDALIQRLSRQSDVKTRALALEATRRFPGGGDSLLRLFFHDPDRTLRLAAYQALADRKESVRHFVAGLHDPAFEIRVYCIRHLVEAGSDAVLPFLLQRMKEYAENTGEDPEVSRPIAFVSAAGDRGKTLSIKSLALQGFARLGGPSPELWQGLLNKERDEASLLEVARAIESSVPPHSGIPLLLKRLKQGAPDGLFIETMKWIERVRWKQALPLAYQLVILHPSPEVRQSALAAAGTIHYPQVFQQILKDSRHPNVEVRANAAEALAAFRENRAVGRLTIMLKDPDPSVRGRAAKSLKELNDRMRN